MIIEMCGLPGCGKSTLIRQCGPNRDLLLDRRRVFMSAHYSSQIFKFLPGFVPLPEDYRRLREFATGYPNAHRTFRSKLLRLNYVLGKCASGIMLLDEGPVQYITSVPFDIPVTDDEALEKAISVLCRDEKLVFYCDCPVETAVSRLQERKKDGYTDNGRYDVDDTEELRRLLEVKEKNIKTVLKHYPGPVVEIDMRADLCENAAVVRKSIEELCGLDGKDIWK